MPSARKRAGPDDGLRDRLAALRLKIETQRAELSQFCAELDPGPPPPPQPVDRGAEQGPEEGSVTTVVTRTGTIPTNTLFWAGVAVTGAGVIRWLVNPQHLSAVYRATSAQANAPLLLPAPSVGAGGADPFDGWPPPEFWNASGSPNVPRYNKPFDLVPRPSQPGRVAGPEFRNASGSPNVPHYNWPLNLVPRPSQPGRVAGPGFRNASGSSNVPDRDPVVPPSPDAPQRGGVDGTEGPRREPSVPVPRPPPDATQRGDVVGPRGRPPPNLSTMQDVFPWLKKPEAAAFNKYWYETAENWVNRIDEAGNSAQLAVSERSRLYALLAWSGMQPYRSASEAAQRHDDAPPTDYQLRPFGDADVLRLIDLTKRIITPNGTLRTDILYFLTSDDVRFIEWAAPQLRTHEHYRKYQRLEGEKTDDYDDRVEALRAYDAAGHVWPPFVGIQRDGRYGYWRYADVVRGAKEKIQTAMYGEPQRIAQLLVDNVLGTLLAPSERSEG